VKILIALLVLIAAPVSAQRNLHWSDIEVSARLEADGTLRVTERQTMVFTGNWNGGERRFNVPGRQRFTFDRMYRVDEGGDTHLMREGDLTNVDEYDFVNSTTLRWRSRLPSDPLFNRTAITYVLEYSYANVLQPDDGRWLLDHNFGFADSDGVIERFTVRLELDPSWEASLPDEGVWQATNLPPGQGFVVTVPLRYVGAGDGPAIYVGAAPVQRYAIAAVVLALVASLGRGLITRERENGRLQPLPSHESVDATWLKEHVFAHLPETVGAAWDNTTDASEVAAVLARLVTEGRMKSEVTPGRLLKGPALHLDLLVDRDRFHGYERTLVDALFEPGETSTDTESIRRRYKSSGFNPAEKIKKPLKDIVAGLTPVAALSTASAWPTVIMVMISITLLGIAIGREPADAPVVIIGAGVTIVSYLLALIGAVVWRSRVHNLGASAAMFLVPWGFSLMALLAVIISGVTLASTIALGGLALLFVALAKSLFYQARSRENVERIALRRRLATARVWFAHELQAPEPRLKDEWFPYLIAFGLGKHMDRWFAAFGGTSHTHHHHYSTSSPGNGSGGGWTGFGGGGGFSGGGASASWAAAAGSMAAGVSAPSSSSSGGGGGGGGGSSGGGGGGGW
jgi:uncharacterized membrane protein YgcG